MQWPIHSYPMYLLLYDTYAWNSFFFKSWPIIPSVKYIHLNNICRNSNMLTSNKIFEIFICIPRYLMSSTESFLGQTIKQRLKWLVIIFCRVCIWRVFYSPRISFIILNQLTYLCYSDLEVLTHNNILHDWLYFTRCHCPFSDSPSTDIGPSWYLC